MDSSPPGSSVYGILQARILDWVAISSRDLPSPGIESESPVPPELQVDSLPLSHWETYLHTFGAKLLTGQGGEAGENYSTTVGDWMGV